MRDASSVGEDHFGLAAMALQKVVDDIISGRWWYSGSGDWDVNAPQDYPSHNLIPTSLSSRLGPSATLSNRPKSHAVQV